MQATVATFSADTRSGTVLLDDGTELPFDAAAFDAGGLRLLRLGQRVRIKVESGNADADREGGTAQRRVTHITLSTFPLPD